MAGLARRAGHEAGAPFRDGGSSAGGSGALQRSGRTEAGRFGIPDAPLCQPFSGPDSGETVSTLGGHCRLRGKSSDLHRVFRPENQGLLRRHVSAIYRNGTSALFIEFVRRFCWEIVMTGRSSGRGAASRPRGSGSRPERQCANPYCLDTDPRQVIGLSMSARKEAPPDILAKLRAYSGDVKRCFLCGVVYLPHSDPPREIVGYYDAPTAQGVWRSYPPHIKPPRD